MSYFNQMALWKIFIIIITTIGLLNWLSKCIFNSNLLDGLAPWITGTTAICALISANRVSEKWKEQKAFDLEKELIFKIISDISKLQQDSIIFYNELENTRIELEASDLKDKNLNKLKDVDYDLSSLDGNIQIYLLLNKSSPLDENGTARKLLKDIELLIGVLTIFKCDFLEVYSGIHTDKKTVLIPKIHLLLYTKENFNQINSDEKISCKPIDACFLLNENLSKLKREILENNQII